MCSLFVNENVADPFDREFIIFQIKYFAFKHRSDNIDFYVMPAQTVRHENN